VGVSVGSVGGASAIRHSGVGVKWTGSEDRERPIGPGRRNARRRKSPKDGPLATHQATRGAHQATKSRHIKDLGGDAH